MLSLEIWVNDQIKWTPLGHLSPYILDLGLLWVNYLVKVCKHVICVIVTFTGISLAFI